jgi:hypothetical protein
VVDSGIADVVDLDIADVVDLDIADVVEVGKPCSLGKGSPGVNWKSTLSAFFCQSTKVLFFDYPYYQ